MYDDLGQFRPWISEVSEYFIYFGIIQGIFTSSSIFFNHPFWGFQAQKQKPFFSHFGHFWYPKRDTHVSRLVPCFHGRGWYTSCNTSGLPGIQDSRPIHECIHNMQNSGENKKQWLDDFNLEKKTEQTLFFIMLIRLKPWTYSTTLDHSVQHWLTSRLGAWCLRCSKLADWATLYASIKLNVWAFSPDLVTKCMYECLNAELVR